jgi:hypothetical protein
MPARTAKRKIWLIVSLCLPWHACTTLIKYRLLRVGSLSLSHEELFEMLLFQGRHGKMDFITEEGYVFQSHIVIVKVLRQLSFQKVDE